MRYQVSIQREPMRAILDLKNSASQLTSILTATGFTGTAPDLENTYVVGSSITVCWIGPEHWWVLAPIEQENELKARISELSSGGAESAVLLSDSMAFFSITGKDALDVLAIASPLDIESSSNIQANDHSTNTVSWTDCFGLKALVICRDVDRYELAVDASFAPMIAECLGKSVGADLSALGSPVCLTTDNTVAKPQVDV